MCLVLSICFVLLVGFNQVFSKRVFLVCPKMLTPIVGVPGFRKELSMLCLFVLSIKYIEDARRVEVWVTSECSVTAYNHGRQNLCS